MPLKKAKVLALLEAQQVVNSPARIALNFASDCRDRVDFTIVTFVRGEDRTADGTLVNPVPSAAAEVGIPCHIVREATRFDPNVILQLKRICKSHNPDIVQTNSIKSHFLVSMLRNRRFGWLAFHHGYTAEDLKMRLYNHFDRFSLRACDGVVTVCNAFISEVAQQGVRREKIFVTPNGISPGFIKPDEEIARRTRSHFGVAQHEKVLLSVGRLSPEKGLKYLIEAMALIGRSGSYPGLKLFIAGAGLLEASLASQISASGLSDTVKLIGYQIDVRPLFMIADIFVLPSLSEGCPMVLLESMVAKVPVISTNVGGIPEAVTDGESARLVPPGDCQVLSSAILEFLRNPEYARKFAEAAHERVKSSFSPQLYNRRVLSAFQRVMPQAASSTLHTIPSEP